MTYATAADLLARTSAEELAQRADRSTPRLVGADLMAATVSGASLASWTAPEQAAAQAALALINAALADADSTINGYLATRYTVPLVPAVLAVSRNACDLARYYLCEDQATETVQKRYDAALAWLRDVAAGRVSLGDAVTPPPASGGSVVMTTGSSVFRRDCSKGFI